MASDLLNFSKRMARRADSLDRVGNESSIRGGLAALDYLIRVTPVDTSRAVSNWQVSIGGLFVQTEIAPYFYGKSGSTGDSSGRQAYAEGARLIKAKTPGQTIYISNVLRYISALDKGSSTQAPLGMTYGVRAVVLRAMKARK